MFFLEGDQINQGYNVLSIDSDLLISAVAYVTLLQEPVNQNLNVILGSLINDEEESAKMELNVSHTHTHWTIFYFGKTPEWQSPDVLWQNNI